MAKQGLKKRAEENTKRLRLLTLAVAAANVLHLAVRFGLRWHSLLTVDWLGLALTSGLYFFCFGTLRKSAAPTYSEAGELLDGGEALDKGGLLGYYQDLTYICILAQVGSLLTRRMWLVFLTVPAYGGFMLWRYVLQPYLQAPAATTQADAKESAAERKRREKQERKQQRGPVYRR